MTSYLDSAAKAFGFDEQIPHDQRYERAEEYLEVVYKILEGSWKEDSRIMDAALGRYSASERVRELSTVGRWQTILPKLVQCGTLMASQKVFQDQGYSPAPPFSSAYAIHSPGRCL